MNTKTPIIEDDICLSLQRAVSAGLVVPANDDLAYDAGFRLTVAYSKACFDRHVQWTAPATFQDETGRAWDVLMLSALALHTNVNDHGQAHTAIESVPPGGQTPERDELRVVWLGDEDDEPVVLIILEHERVRSINRAAAAVGQAKE